MNRLILECNDLLKGSGFQFPDGHEWGGRLGKVL